MAINTVLLNAFVGGQDHVVAGGEKFWTGAKRFPRAAELDVHVEDQHLAFVLCTANLLAAGYGVSPQADGLLPPGHPQRDVEGAGMFVRLSMDVGLPSCSPTCGPGDRK